MGDEKPVSNKKGDASKKESARKSLPGVFKAFLVGVGVFGALFGLYVLLDWVGGYLRQGVGDDIATLLGVAVVFGCVFALLWLAHKYVKKEME